MQTVKEEFLQICIAVAIEKKKIAQQEVARLVASYICIISQ